MPSVEPYGPKIRSLRGSLGLTQLELALRAGVSDRTVRKAEQGVPIKREFLAFLAGALGVDVQEIVRLPAEVEGLLRWRRNLETAMQLTTHVGSDGNVSDLLDLIQPTWRIVHCLDSRLSVGGMSDRFQRDYVGYDGARRTVDLMNDFCETIVDRVIIPDPPAGDGDVVILRGTDSRTHVTGIQERSWYLHVYDFDDFRISRILSCGGPLPDLKNDASSPGS